MNGRTNSSGTTINDLEIPLDPCTNLVAVAGNGQVSLTWTDPKDKYATPEGEAMEDTDQLVSEWDHTILVRKTGSQPAGPNDGTVVVSSSVRDQYKTSAYVDSDLTNDTTYYYGVFVYNKDGVASSGAFTSSTPKAGTFISSLSEGTLIKMNESGTPVEFYVSKINYEEGLNGPGRVLVVRKDVYNDQVWDRGNLNAYASSDLDSWFNSTYKNMLDADIHSLIGTTKFRYTPGNNNYTVGTLERAVFALSATELGWSKSWFNVEGSALPIASTLNPAYHNGNENSQWTRSPSTDNSIHTVVYVSAYSGVSDDGCYNSYGSRPAFTLPSTITVDENMNVIVPSSTALQAA